MLLALKGDAYQHDTQAFQRGLLSPEDVVLANKTQLKAEKRSAKLLRTKMKIEQKKCDRLFFKAAAKAEKNGTEPPLRVVLTNPVVSTAVSYNQTPMMTVPRCLRLKSSNSTTAINTVAVRCCVPPAPGPPMVRCD